MKKFTKKIYETSTLHIEDLEITLYRKAVKKIYIRVASNNGEIYIIAPKKYPLIDIKVLILEKLSWIKKYHQHFLANKTPEINFCNGDQIELFGKKYLLEIKRNQQKNLVSTDYHQKITFLVNDQIDHQSFEKLLNHFYRIELKKILIPMVNKWQKNMKLTAKFIGIKKMKTKWGSCNFNQARLWFSSELAKKPIEAIEYVVVHELGHLIEPSHNKKFAMIMNHYLPNWQDSKKKLGYGRI